jgi:hypothetical protein
MKLELIWKKNSFSLSHVPFFCQELREMQESQAILQEHNKHVMLGQSRTVGPRTIID